MFAKTYPLFLDDAWALFGITFLATDKPSFSGYSPMQALQLQLPEFFQHFLQRHQMPS
jgi:hypothetical protein